MWSDRSDEEEPPGAHRCPSFWVLITAYGAFLLALSIGMALICRSYTR